MSKKLLEPHLWSLETLLKCIYNIPVYQRPYSWDKEQVDVLLEDIFKRFNSSNRTEGYYTGNIIIYDKDLKIDGYITSYDVIDGQQRIVTFSLILLATYSLSAILGVSSTDFTLSKLREVLWKSINRENKKELRIVTLNSIEKECFEAIYDQCFENPKNILEYCNNYSCNTVFDERIITNFSYIYRKISEEIKSQQEILDFVDYLLTYINFIGIEANCKQQEVFSMFESINGKGKQLEVIDLIKTYIFSKLDEESYESYSKKWGNLINATEDNLYDYLYTYIRAYIAYYRQNINIDNFKSISMRELIIHFNAKSLEEALKLLIDDMTLKVDYYNMLKDTEKAYKLVKSSKFRFFYSIFVNNGYQHPKALFFRALVDFKNASISKNDIEEIVVETVTFMVKFLTISDRDSKDAISVFYDIMTEIIKSKKIDSRIIINKLESQLILRNITPEYLKATINTLDCYSEKREISIPLLALYESIDKKDGKNVISYNQAYQLVKDFSKFYSLDHLLVQTPDINDNNFKYYNDNNILMLKDGHDFPSELVQTGMNYDVFTKSILNRIGNLRIYYRDKNSSRGNEGVSLPDNKNFYNYANIVKRGKDVADCIFDFCMPSYKIDIKKIDLKVSKNKTEKKLDMNDFFQMGVLSKGDEVYITIKPSFSVATLIDSKYVIYNNEKMTINEWGRKVTGWKSIRIYEYMAKVGEKETLQDKRDKYRKEIE